MTDLISVEEPTKWGKATETSATRYSRTNAPQHGLGNSLSTMMKISEGQHVLVTACGPGNDALAIARIVGQSGRVVGFDLDKHSIDRAREALEKHPDLKPYVQFHVADAHDLSMFAGQTFDAIHCNASYHWFTNKPLFLAQVATLAKPGAVIGIATQDRNFQPPMLDIRTEVLAELGENATDFIFHPTPTEMRRDLGAAGFGDAKLLGYYGTYVLESAEAMWNWVNDSSGNRFGNYLEEGKRERMKQMMLDRFGGLALKDGKVVMQFKHIVAMGHYGR
ncbi:unnamed protein product [Alternaria burnsii]|nr:unnamed protein product [Alternaria burnsii]